jgi:hypothetical protein
MGSRRAIDLNHTPVPVDSAQAKRKRPREEPLTTTIQARALFDDLTTPTPADTVLPLPGVSRRRRDHPHGVVINPPQPQPEVFVDLVSNDDK